MDICFVDFEGNGLYRDCTEIYGFSWELEDGTHGFQELHWKLGQDYSHQPYYDIVGERIPVFHNASYDVAVGRKFGLAIPDYHCTLIMGYSLNPNMKSLSQPGHKPSKYSLWAWGLRLGFPKLDPPTFSKWTPEMATYSIRDVQLTHKIWDTVFPKLLKDEEGWNHYNTIDRPYIEVIMELQDAGMPVDLDELEAWREELEPVLDGIRAEVNELIPFIHGKKGYHKVAHPERQDIVYTGNYDPVKGHEWRLKIPFDPATTCKSHVVQAYQQLYGIRPDSGEGDVLATTYGDYDLTKYIIDARQLHKLLGTYVSSFVNGWDNGFVYGNWHHAATKTGRLSCTNPPLQTLPARDELGSTFRRFVRYTDPEWCMVGIDLSNIEYRVLFAMMAIEYKNRTGMIPDDVQFVIDAFNEGEDYHDTMTRLWFGIDKDHPDWDKCRKQGKNISFARVFGAGDRKLALMMRTTLQDAKKKRAIADESNPSFQQFWEWTTQDFYDTGGFGHTLYGRRLVYPNFRLDPYATCNQELPSEGVIVKPGEASWWIQRGERQAFNARIQGSAADVLKILGLAALPRVWYYGGRLHAPVHDELLFGIRREHAEDFAGELDVIFNRDDILPYIRIAGKPVIGDNWLEVH